MRRDPVKKLVEGVQQDYSPPWWRAAQVVIAVVFVAAMAWQVLVGAGSTPPRAAPPAPTPAPTATADPTPSPDVPERSTTTVPGVSAGQSHEVDTDAYEAAVLSFRAAFDPLLAEDVPMVDGEIFPAGSTRHPDATIAKVRVSELTGDRVAFVALGDADGSGPQRAVYLTATVLRDADGWAVTTQ